MWLNNQFKPQDDLSGISKTIQDKAKQFTVRIDYPDGNGSGVIVAKNGETYYVLTAKHVVEQEQDYKLVTPDEKEYNVDAGKIKTLEGADLAVLQFQSGETYQVATLADYKTEFEEDLENEQKLMDKFFKKSQEHSEKSNEELAKSTVDLVNQIDNFTKQNVEEITKYTENLINQIDNSSGQNDENTTKQESEQASDKASQELEQASRELEQASRELDQASQKSDQLLQESFKDSQIRSPWLFILGWQRVNNTPQLRLTAGRDFTFIGGGDVFGDEKKATFASQNFDSLARSQSYQLSYTNFSQGGMSGGAVLDTLGRVIGIHAAAEGETSGLEEIQLGFSFGIPTKKVLSSISQAGIKPEWLKVEKVRPPRITTEDKQSITKNLLEIDPPGHNATEADWLNYGNDLWRIQRYQEASTAFDEAIKRKPDFYQAYFGKGLVINFQEGQRFAQKLPSVRQPSMSSVMKPSSFLESSEIPPGASIEEITQIMAKDRQKMQEYNRKFHQQMKEDKQLMKKTGKEFMSAITSGSQRQAKALPFFKKATEINPNFYPAWREIGNIKSTEVNNYVLQEAMIHNKIPDKHIPLDPKATLAAKEALAAYNKATALNPSDSQLYGLKGDVLQKSSRHQEAIDAFTQAIKINPSPIFYSSRSESYCAIGDKQKAEADMLKTGMPGIKSTADINKAEANAKMAEDWGMGSNFTKALSSPVCKSEVPPQN